MGVGVVGPWAIPPKGALILQCSARGALCGAHFGQLSWNRGHSHCGHFGLVWVGGPGGGGG